MRATILLGICAAAIPFIALGADDDDHRKPGDSLESILGEWSVTWIRFAEIEVKGTSQQFMNVSFTKDQMTTRPGYIANYTWDGTLGGNDGFRLEKRVNFSLSSRDKVANLRIDASGAPSRIDLDEIDRNKKVVRTEKGIYRLKDKELELCIGSGGRPREFKADTSTVILRLKRMEKKDNHTPRP